MKRIKLVVSYDGTRYHGWQIQKNGITIEEELNKALKKLLKEEIQVIGASRTDSGVHAFGNVAVFDTESKIPAEKMCFALNQRLPDDIRVRESEEVPNDWHPRKQNAIKTYEYQILNQQIELPLYRLYSHFYYLPLDVDKMRQAAAYLIGEHDFKSFCTVRTNIEDTVRKIYYIDIIDEPPLIKIRISGNGFLYNMVRIIVGTLVKVGVGKYSPELMETILDARDRSAAGPTIPAKGLTLVSLEYEKELLPVLTGKNRYWDYLLLQHQTETDKNSYLIIRECSESEFDSLLTRVIHQAVRNGADQVYLSCLSEPKAKVGDRYGFYQIDTVEDEKVTEKMISEKIGRCALNTDEEMIVEQAHQSGWLKAKNLDFIGEKG